MTPSWWVKIGDFGIAKRARDGDTTELRTATGTQAMRPLRSGAMSTWTNRIQVAYILTWLTYGRLDASYIKLWRNKCLSKPEGTSNGSAIKGYRSLQNYSRGS
jgi:hypothetical protein